jgi:hypothetical protein
VDSLWVPDPRWTAPAALRTVPVPAGDGLRVEGGTAEGTTDPRAGSGGGSARIAGAPHRGLGAEGPSEGPLGVPEVDTGWLDRREADRPSRDGPPGSEGGCRRRSDRTDRRSGIVQADGRPRGRPGRTSRRPPPGGATDASKDRPPPRRTAPPGVTDGRARTRAGRLPTRRDRPSGWTTREAGALSRGAHPSATPRWARKGARGVRASGGRRPPRPAADERRRRERR